MAAGIIERCLEVCLQYTTEREQWGRPIARFQLMQDKVARMYGNWFYIGEMPLGENTVRVELSSNDHSTLMFDGEMIDDSVTVMVDESDPHSHGADA